MNINQKLTHETLHQIQKHTHVILSKIDQAKRLSPLKAANDLSTENKSQISPKASHLKYKTVKPSQLLMPRNLLSLNPISTVSRKKTLQTLYNSQSSSKIQPVTSILSS